MPWLTVIAVVNLGIWTLFGYLVWRRRWTRASLAVAALHILLISPMSAAPLRAMTESATFHLGLGWVQVSGAIAAVPALIIWSWGLSAAVIALTRPNGGALSVIAIGDFALAANFGTFFTVTALEGALREFRAQGGEFVILSGLGWAALFLVVFVVPFTYSALWAVRNIRLSPPSASSRGTPAASTSHSEDRHSGAKAGRSFWSRRSSVDSWA